MKSVGRFSWLLIVVAGLVLTGCLGATTDKPAGDDDDDDNTGSLEVQGVASVTSGVAPLDVEFTGVAAGGVEPYTYRWEFGDGATESTATSYHIYEAPGNFVATFTATDAEGAFGSATISLVVGADDVPVVQATSDVTSGTAPLAVNFTGTVSGGDAPVAVEWSFGDGSTSTDLEPSYTYQFSGNYVVTFTATDATGDEAEATLMITVGSDSKPVVAVGADPTSGPAPLNVQFEANAAGGDAPLTYAWDFGDGDTSTDTNPTHTYTADGTYNAKVTVTDADGDTAMSSAAIVVQSQSSTDPDLRLISFDYILAGLADDYEPNDSELEAFYMGSYGYTYSLTDGYIDPYDALFRCTVANVGPAVGDGFLVDFYKNRTDAPALGDFGDDFETVLSIGENGTKDVFFTWEQPVPGEYMSWAQVDSDDFVAESAEDNNVTAGMPVTVISDEDWYSVYQTEGFNITVDLENLPDDFDLAVYDESMALVGFSIESGTTAENVSISAPADGYYYIRVYGYAGASSNGQPYHLTVAVE